MSSIRKVKRTIEKNRLRFPVQMYADTLGSLAVVGWMFSEEKPNVAVIKKQWRKIMNGDVPVTFEDPDFIEKGLEYFGMKTPKVFPIAFVQSDWNAVFAPYVNENLLPNREDGYYIATLRKGKVYPITFGCEEKDDEQLGRDTE